MLLTFQHLTTWIKLYSLRFTANFSTAAAALSVAAAAS